MIALTLGLYVLHICHLRCIFSTFFFFFNDTATTEIYTLSLTTLFRSEPILEILADESQHVLFVQQLPDGRSTDRKSTRLNSSHSSISYAVFCLKKKKH